MEHYHGGAEEWVACLPLQNKLRELLGGVSEQMLAEDGITVTSYMVAMNGAGSALGLQQLRKWVVAAQNRFVDRIYAQAGPRAVKLEPVPAVPQPASAPASGKLGLEQPGKVARHTESTAQEPVKLPPMPTQENTLEAPRSPPRPQAATSSAELDAAPPAFTRAKQTGVSQVSCIAFHRASDGIFLTCIFWASLTPFSLAARRPAQTRTAGEH
jgi:hypothetical protein